MLMRVQAFTLGMILAAGTASAASVQIEFTDGQNTSGSLDAAGENASGVWSEGGYDVMWDFIDQFGAPNAPVDPAFTDFTLLSDCGIAGGCFGHGEQMTITNRNGSPFSLTGMTSAYTVDGYVVDASLTFYRPDGTLNFNDQQSYTGPLVRDSIALRGTRSDGSTVIGTGASGSAASALDGFQSFGSGPVSISDGTLAAFSDLMSLTVSANGAAPTDAEVYDTLMEANGAPSDLLYAVATCGFESCNLPGVGELTYDLVFAGGRNDTIAVDIDGIGLDSADPAHAPLPASVLFLGAGLGLLGFGRLRRKR